MNMQKLPANDDSETADGTGSGAAEAAAATPDDATKTVAVSGAEGEATPAAVAAPASK